MNEVKLEGSHLPSLEPFAYFGMEICLSDPILC
jgi:hypothetical protein